MEDGNQCTVTHPLKGRCYHETSLMQVALPDLESPARIVLDSGHPLTEDEYYAFCQANPDLRVERTAQGEIVIVPPTGGESSYRSGKGLSQLETWARKDGCGKVFDSSAQFTLPDGSALSPDAA